MSKYKKCDYEIFSFNVKYREIILSDKVIKLNYNESLLLDYMIRNESKILNKKDLIHEGWPDTCVTDSSLHKSISKLRSILESEDIGEIETISGIGYVFRQTNNPDKVLYDNKNISSIYIYSILLCLLSFYFSFPKKEDSNYFDESLRIMHLDDGDYNKEIILTNSNSLSQLAIERITEYQCGCTFFYMTLSNAEHLSVYHPEKHEVENLVLKKDILE